MSLTCGDEIGRVGRGRYEDASDLSATCRACRARGIWRTTRHTDKRVALDSGHRSRPPDDESGKRVASWTGKSPDTSPDTRDILVASSRACSACRARRQGCHEDARRKLLQWNLSLRWTQCQTACSHAHLSRSRYIIYLDLQGSITGIRKKILYTCVSRDPHVRPPGSILIVHTRSAAGVKSFALRCHAARYCSW